MMQVAILALLHFRTPLLLLMTHYEKTWRKALPLPYPNPNPRGVQKCNSAQFCGILEPYSGQELPQFLVVKLESFPQLISNEVSDCIPNI